MHRCYTLRYSVIFPAHRLWCSQWLPTITVISVTSLVSYCLIKVLLRGTAVSCNAPDPQDSVINVWNLILCLDFLSRFGVLENVDILGFILLALRASNGRKPAWQQDPSDSWGTLGLLCLHRIQHLFLYFNIFHSLRCSLGLEGHKWLDFKDRQELPLSPSLTSSWDLKPVFLLIGLWDINNTNSLISWTLRCSLLIH